MVRRTEIHQYYVRLRGCLVASHNLSQLTLGKCGKPQKMWLANWLSHLVMPKEILPHFLTLWHVEPKRIMPKLSCQPNTCQLSQTCLS